MASLAASPAKGNLKQRRSTLHLDMTPMVDLAFLLLTFFVMTTTLMKHSVMEIQQAPPNAEDRHRDIKPENVLNLILGKNDEIYWYIGMAGNRPTRTDFSASGIRKLLNKKRQEIKGLFVFVKASDESRYQNTVDVLDEIVIAGIANYSILDLDPDDEKLLNY